MKKIIFTVSNDLNYDQRMNKICTSLANNGFDVLLLGVKRKKSTPLTTKIFQQKRLPIFFEEGALFYVELSLRFFFFLLFHPCNIIVANDLDTALPVLFASRLKKKKRVFDAHELFCEMHDIVDRPRVYKIWKLIEKFAQPKFKLGYTENESYAHEYKKMYGVNYFIVMNSPYLIETPTPQKPNQDILIYQGSIERGRGFEALIPAMHNIPAKLMVCGDGKFLEQVKIESKKYRVQDKINFVGFVLPEDLRNYTSKATIGLNMNDNLGASFYYSLTNRFFDYMHALLPQITMNYPENKKINDRFEIAVLIDDLQPKTIENTINRLLNDTELYNRLQQNCLKAREMYNWQKEEKKLIDFYLSLDN